jgi:hypothetical protein
MDVFGGGVDTLVVTDGDLLPAMVTVYFPMRLSGTVSEWRCAHRREVRVRGPSGIRDLSVIDNVVDLPEASLLEPEFREIGILLPTRCVFAVIESGVYTFSFLLDDVPARELTLRVEVA